MDALNQLRAQDGRVIIELEEFRAEAAAWLDTNRAEAPPNYGAILPPGLVAAGVEWQKRLLGDGWAGLHWPVEHGGRGLTPEHQGIWLEECARANVPPFINMVGFVLAGQGVQLYGTDEQKVAHLRPILDADRLWCQLFSEPEAGSDLGSLRTTAQRDGDGWMVNGQKVWCSGGRYSDWGILMARTDGDLPKHKGISFFLVDMHSDGIEARPLRQMTGEAEFDEVFFTDLHLPESALLGPENGGWGVGMTTLTNERGSIGAGAISMQRRLDAMAGMGEGELGPIERQRLVESLSQGRTLHLLAQRQGPAASVASSLNKLGITELMFAIAGLRADLGGARSMLDGPDVASLLGAPGARIAGGTSQVQRNIIGERILGLPREPRPPE
jgi:alkylation response protein AidB-like acyl-CoA dehydrogenase